MNFKALTFLLLIGLSSLSYCQDSIVSERTFIFYRDRDYGTLNIGARIEVNKKPTLVLGPNSLDTLFVPNDTVQLSIGKTAYMVLPNSRSELFFKIVYDPSIIYFFGKFSLVQVEKEFFAAIVNLKGRRRGIKLK